MSTYISIYVCTYECMQACVNTHTKRTDRSQVQPLLQDCAANCRTCGSLPYRSIQMQLTRCVWLL